MTPADPAQPDPSQPLTLDRPLTDPRVDSPYPRLPQPQYARAQMPPSLYTGQEVLPPRTPDQYGQDFWARQAATNYPGVPQGPDMPSGLESYPAMAKSNGYLAKWGSDNINQDAGRVSNLAMGFAPILDLISRGGWSREFNASTLNQLKLQQERLILEQERVQMKHAGELTDYGSILAKADALIAAAGTDSGKIQQITEDAREELRFVAETKYGHHPLVALLDQTAGLNPVKDFLNREDASFREAWAGLTSLKKVTNSDRDSETRSEFGLSGGGGAGGIAPGIFSATPTPEEPTIQGPQAPQTGSTSDYDRDILKKTGASPEELAMARQAAMGQTPESYARRAKLPASQRTPLENRALSDVDRLTNQMSRDTEEAANAQDFNRLRQINPALAADIGQLGTYAVDPLKEDRLGDRRYINSLVGRFFPGWDPSLYQVKKNIEDDTKPEGKTIKAAGGALGPMMLFLDATKKVPQHDSVPIAVIRQALANNVTNDPQYRELALAAQQLAVQLNAITTGSGVTRVTIFRQRMDNMGAYVSPETLRTLLKQEAVDIWEAGVAQYQNTWETKFKRKDLVPGVTPDMWKDYSSILRMDPKTGRMPRDASNDMLAVGRNVKEGNEPLTAQQAREVEKRLTAIRNNPDFHNPGSPNYKELQHNFDVYTGLIPPVRLPPWMKSEFD